MQALIDVKTQVQYVSAWKLVNNIYEPVFTAIPNSERVCQVQQNSFEVAPSLFWVACPDNVVADEWYYNNQTQQFIVVPEPPTIPQPTVSGAQTL